ncbi:hypothetical protein TEA_029370 [Camellia sinensis var. sinensis]|uniref:BHLH domain-containing protein n=1 Tax=Camellia sinensis var. sinensis TaxID=542762 RepID=A0A4S4DXA7_CAMSN|nr:hypothetical protein TEA_029370 [Camellia sinensis var. sinensis]
MEDPGFTHQWPSNSLADINTVSIIAPSFWENSHHSFSHPIFDLEPSMEVSSHTDINRPVKILKINSWNSSNTDHVSNPPQATSSPNQIPFYATQVGTLKTEDQVLSSESIITFSSDILESQGSFGNQNCVFKASQGGKRISTNTKLSNNQDHIMAERKRREKLSQRFIALSAIVPGLKKMDKASVLGDAIKYLKQLEERVKTLEEQVRKKPIESVIFVKKHEVCGDSEISSSDENFSGGPYDEPLPQIEARICDKDVLIRVHCEKRKGVLEKTVEEIEKLRLRLVEFSKSSSTLTFEYGVCLGFSNHNSTLISQNSIQNIIITFQNS